MKNIIYSKEDCPYCVKAKKILSDMNIPYQEVMLSSDADKTMMVSTILDKEGIVVSTVPQIYIEGEYVGGHDDLVAWRERQALGAELSDLDNFFGFKGIGL